MWFPSKNKKKTQKKTSSSKIKKLFKKRLLISYTIKKHFAAKTLVSYQNRFL